MKWRPIIFGVIILICIVSINYAIFWALTQEKKPEPVAEVTIDSATILHEFTLIFDNTIDEQNYSVESVVKKDNTQKLVYTATQVKENVDGKYEINVNIPNININQNSVDELNKEIQQVFYSKVDSLKANADNVTVNQTEEQVKKVNTVIYNVEYKAYVNSNILSLVIKATLKEGVNQQRIMVKTYNYNLTTNEEMKLDQLKEIKGVNTETIQKRIQTTINQANEQASDLDALGYSVLYRKPEDDIYDIEKSNDSINCFLGKEGIMYIVYPYGNRENTSEMDIIVFE